MTTVHCFTGVKMVRRLYSRVIEGQKRKGVTFLFCVLDSMNPYTNTLQSRPVSQTLRTKRSHPNPFLYRKSSCSCVSYSDECTPSVLPSPVLGTVRSMDHGLSRPVVLLCGRSDGNGSSTRVGTLYKRDVDTFGSIPPE